MMSNDKIWMNIKAQSTFGVVENTLMNIRSRWVIEPFNDTVLTSISMDNCVLFGCSCKRAERCFVCKFRIDFWCCSLSSLIVLLYSSQIARVVLRCWSLSADKDFWRLRLVPCCFWMRALCALNCCCKVNSCWFSSWLVLWSLLFAFRLANNLPFTVWCDWTGLMEHFSVGTTAARAVCSACFWSVWAVSYDSVNTFWAVLSLWILRKRWISS